MKISKPVIILGIIGIIAGIIFHLQGQAIVGPESSFMYANQEWVSYGQQITIIGIVVTGIGIVIKFLKKA